MLQIAIPAVGFLVGLLLYRKRPTVYIAYSLWVWVLIPLIRRIVDYNFGWHNQSLILLTPHLVTSVSVLDFTRSRDKTIGAIPVSILLCLGGVLYGLAIGLLLHPSAELALGLLNWITPLLFGAHLARDWKHYEPNRAAILTCMIWITGVMGVYGVYQFMVAPAWDRYWLEMISPGLMDPSFGQPEPMAIRVWSTLNSPGIFSFVMAAALLFATTAITSIYALPFTIAGYLAFLLCQVRAAWLAWLLGLVLVLRRSNSRTVVRVVGSVAVLAICMAPILLAFEDVSQMISDRVSSLSDVQSDYSVRERQEVYQVVLGTILHEPFGHGLRSLESVGNLPVDSGILSTLLSMGWIGTGFYLAGVAVALARPRGGTSDAFMNTCRAVCFANLAQYFAGNVFVNIGGNVFWMCAGLSIAGFKWRDLQQTLELTGTTEAGAPHAPAETAVPVGT